MSLRPDSWFSRYGPALAAHLLVLAAGAYPLGSAHLTGWIASDEGYLNSSAARLAAGEVPHRDWIERFPGALVVWNAAARAVFGETLAGPRRGLLLAALVLLVLLHDLARRVLPPVPAALVALAASAWGVPRWFAANPTWFVLLFGLAAGRLLIAALPRDRAVLYLLAGAGAGVAWCFKQTAGAFVAAALFAVVALAGVERARDGGARGGRLDALAGALAAAMLPVVLQFVLLRQHSLYFVVLLVAAPAGLAAAVIVEAARGHAGAGTARRALLLGGGFLLGLVPLTLYYAAHGALADAVRGIFALQWDAALRHALPYTGIVLGPPIGKALVWAGCGALAAALPRKAARAAPLGPLAYAIAAAVVGVGGSLAAVVETAVREIVMFLPLGVGAAAATVALRGRKLGPAAVPVLLSSALFGVVYPLGAFLYAWYVAPAAILGAAALARRAYGSVVVAVAAALALGAALAFPPGADMTDAGPAADRRTIAIPGRGGGLLAPAAEGAAILAVVNEVRARTEPGEPVFTYPADFLVYELAGRPNPTRHLWVDFYAGPEEFGEILDTLDRLAVPVVVVRTTVPIHNPFRAGFLEELGRRYAVVAHYPPYVLTVRREPADDEGTDR